ncbi:Mediator of RNA polymerase II transcription subunit 28 [Pseudolycoriella hygida]|uniref:Mediator of RNA polymerase II transcription subunit 28 n=1 Tax=Pseudolycoriella hygida TaxID=35572 RepID=A0A9Q0S635_9DIPT|nr:Mediator of RNA polymerase II transcription subunit 28 [Pseudolycoriella hygida]
MASSSNGNGNLVDEFEEAFQACIHSLTKQESATGIDKDEINLEVDQTTIKFVDLARQMEAFFIQKRFLLSALKPELVLKEENFDLRYEATRKDDLIRRHYEKIEQWKNLLTDLQPQGGAPSERNVANAVGPSNQPPQPGQMPIAGMPNHMVMQQQQQQQQMQQQMMQAQQMNMQQHLQVGSQQMFMQQGNQMANRGGFNQAQNVLQGPLAYLEKTTSNIDLVGMGDGRR